MLVSGVNLKDGSGTFHPSPYVRASSSSGRAGPSSSSPSRVIGATGTSAERSMVAGDVGHQVEHVVDEVAAEHVDAAAAAVGEVDPDLEVGLAHPHDLPAELLHPPGRGVVLADDVERVGVRAHVGQVGVGVVADHVPVAHRAEQAAEREERLQPALLAEVVQHPLHRLDDQRLGVAVGVGEAALHPAALVDRELVARRVRDADPIGRRAEADLVVEEDLLARRAGVRRRARRRGGTA